MYRIMIVDDEQTERDGIEFLIHRRYPEANISKASGGLDAWAIWQQEPFDIIFTDIKMPVMDGIELCRRIRGQSARAVLVVLSAYGDFEYTQKAIQLRVDDYLLKPVSVEEFDRVLDHALCLAGARALPAAENPADEAVSDTEQESRIVARVIREVEEHYAEDIGLEWAAERVGLSAGYLSSFFKRTVGKSFTQHLIGVRMEKAKALLQQGDRRVAEISKMVGYPNVSYFCLQFKKFYGITPNQIRQGGNKP